MRILFLIGLCFGVVFSNLPGAWGASKETITEENDFGGPTVELFNDDFTRVLKYYNSDGDLVREETIYTSEYQIDNGLERVILYFEFGKKVKEEKVFNAKGARRTLITKSIEYFDRNTEAVVKTENHFLKPYTGFSTIYRENGKKVKIEWDYPDNIDGISRSVLHCDEDEIVVKIESYFTEKTTLENGYFKRVYVNGYNANKYIRKLREEWYYTDEFAASHRGVAKKVMNYKYLPGGRLGWKSETSIN